MKLIYLFSLLAIPLLSFDDSKVKWLSPLEHDYGDIEHNVPKAYNFKFLNISEDVLTIDNVRTSCGCTASDWEDEPIEPADSSSVNITYDAAKIGYFRKKIKVYFHGQRKVEILYIEGFVLEDVD
jgi:Protein of unknown function (DUF1573)